LPLFARTDRGSGRVGVDQLTIRQQKKRLGPKHSAIDKVSY